MYFWAEAVNTACYTQNQTLITKDLMKTPYEIMNNKKPTLKYFHVFGAKSFVLKDGEEHRGKFEAKAHEAIFVGYGRRSYRVYIIDQQVVKESVNVTFDDTKLPSIQLKDPSKRLVFNNLSDSDADDNNDEPEVATGDNNDNDDNDPGANGGNSNNTGDTQDTGEESSSHPDNNSGGEAEGSTSHSQHQNDYQGGSSRTNLPNQRVWNRAHPIELIIGDPDVGVRTRSATQNQCHYSGFLSEMEPRKLRKH